MRKMRAERLLGCILLGVGAFIILLCLPIYVWLITLSIALILFGLYLFRSC